MGALLVTEFMTLDGVMEAPGGEPTHAHTGWVGPFMQDPEALEFKLKETLESEALLLGRVTYESFAGAWPDRDDPQGFAKKMNTMPKYVVSSTLKDPEWANTTVLEGPVVESVGRLKDEIAGTIQVAGSHTLVHELIEAGLVDELTLFVAPTIIGSGMRVFPGGPSKHDFALIETKPLDVGAIVIRYATR